MTKAAEERSLPLARLPGVKFPRMNVEDRRRAAGAVRISQQLSSEAIGKKAEEGRDYMTAKGKEFRRAAEDLVDKGKDLVAKIPV